MEPDSIHPVMIVLVCYGLIGMGYLVGRFVERRGAASDRVDTFNSGRAFERQFGPEADPLWREREAEDEDAVLAEYGV